MQAISSQIILKKRKINLFAIIFSVLLFLDLMLQENAFLSSMKGIWIYIINVLIILIGFCDYIIKKHTLSKKILKDYWHFLALFIIMTIYSLFFCLGKHKIPLDEMLTACLYWIIPICVSGIIFLQLKEDGIRIIYNVILLNYTFVIIKCLAVNGLGYFLKLSTYTNNFGSLLEVHPIGLTLPLFLIYFIVEHIEYGNKISWKLFVGVLYTFMCGKKIALLAFLCSIIVYKCLLFSKRQFSKNKLRILMVLIVVMAIGYLLAVQFDVLTAIALYFGVNFNSRLETWNALKDTYVISPLFTGNGVGYSMYYLKNLNGVYINGVLNKVGDVHNDILKMYIDVGFFPFIYYVWYLLIGNLNYFLKKNLIKTGRLYFIIMIYTVILMFTDNIMRYDLYLMTLFLIPMLRKSNEEHEVYGS